MQDFLERGLMRLSQQERLRFYEGHEQPPELFGSTDRWVTDKTYHSDFSIEWPMLAKALEVWKLHAMPASSAVCWGVSLMISLLPCALLHDSALQSSSHLVRLCQGCMASIHHKAITTRSNAVEQSMESLCCRWQRMPWRRASLHTPSVISIWRLPLQPSHEYHMCPQFFCLAAPCYVISGAHTGHYRLARQPAGGHHCTCLLRPASGGPRCMSTPHVTPALFWQLHATSSQAPSPAQVSHRCWLDRRQEAFTACASHRRYLAAAVAAAMT